MQSGCRPYSRDGRRASVHADVAFLCECPAPKRVFGVFLLAAPMVEATQTAIGETRAMNRALALSRRGMGTVKPNPPVGAVIVADDTIVGEGFHVRAGGDHAEIVALRRAGSRAQGASLFVTLEPCNHQGRTPPCVPAIIEAGVRHVHFAAPDPSPHSGSGMQALTDAGIEVVEG